MRPTWLVTQPSLVHTYSINYVFTGFFSPVTNGGVWNVVNAGRAIPLKWTLTDAAGNFILDSRHRSEHLLLPGALQCR